MSGKFHGQRSLAGNSPWGFEESDVSEQLNTVGLEKASNIILESRTEEKIT